MPRSRPASDPISFHKRTGQYYVTRAGKRIYLGTDRDAAMKRYHRLALGLSEPEQPARMAPLSAKDLANRFLAAQQANWRSRQKTLSGYQDWLGRFLKDHRGLMASELTVEMFAIWKLSLRTRGYSPVSINHYLSAVRAMYAFGEDTGLLDHTPQLKRVKNEPLACVNDRNRALYTPEELGRLLAYADRQLRPMPLLGLNCGFGPKDLRDLTWQHVNGERATLARSKTGICQTYLLWPETLAALNELRRRRARLIARLAKRGQHRSDNGHVFITKYWRPWSSDAIAEQFRKLCANASVPCYGLYRLRHCASTAMSLVATPHLHRRFMRHSQLQQQVTYTHTPDAEVDTAVMRARQKLLPDSAKMREVVLNRREPLEAVRGILLDRLVAIRQEFVEGTRWNSVQWSLTPGPDIDRSEPTGTDERPDVLCRDLQSFGGVFRRQEIMIPVLRRGKAVFSTSCGRRDGWHRAAVRA